MLLTCGLVPVDHEFRGQSKPKAAGNPSEVGSPNGPRPFGQAEGFGGEGTTTVSGCALNPAENESPIAAIELGNAAADAAEGAPASNTAARTTGSPLRPAAVLPPQHARRATTAPMSNGMQKRIATPFRPPHQDVEPAAFATRAFMRRRGEAASRGQARGNGPIVTRGTSTVGNFLRTDRVRRPRRRDRPDASPRPMTIRCARRQSDRRTS